MYAFEHVVKGLLGRSLLHVIGRRKQWHVILPLFQYCLRSGKSTIGDFSSKQLLRTWPIWTLFFIIMKNKLIYAFQHNYFYFLFSYPFSYVHCCSQKDCFNKHCKGKINNKNVTRHFNYSMLMLSKCEENKCRLYLHMSNLGICWNVICFYFSFVNLSLILLNCLHGLSFHWFALVVVIIFNFF